MSKNLYLLPGGKLGFDPPAAGMADFDEYISDPAKPVPYRQRPTLTIEDPDSIWGEWLVDDQRQAASRPDVLVYETDPLKAPLRIAGQPFADIVASTSGTCSVTNWACFRTSLTLVARRTCAGRLQAASTVMSGS